MKIFFEKIIYLPVKMRNYLRNLPIFAIEVFNYRNKLLNYEL